MKRTVYTCDRPGCGADFEGHITIDGHITTAVTVWIRVPPTADMGEVKWDLCEKCADGLRRDRIEADLAFGDRLRPPGKAP